jgi:hypothetical protein
LGTAQAGEKLEWNLLPRLAARHCRERATGTNLQDREHVTTCLTRGDCFYGARRTILSTLTYKF